jgi:hypothetical protein
MGMLLNPCTLYSLAISFDSPALAVSNRFIVMVHQNSTDANEKTASIPERASHSRGAGTGPGRSTLILLKNPHFPTEIWPFLPK